MSVSYTHLGQKEFDEKIADGEKKIIDGENTLKKAEKQYTDRLAEYKTQKKLAEMCIRDSFSAFCI